MKISVNNYKQNGFLLNNTFSNASALRGKDVSFASKTSPNEEVVFLKQLFRKRKELLDLKISDEKHIMAMLFKPRPFDWYMKDGDNFLGYVWLSKTKAKLVGDAVPEDYKDTDCLFINSIESKRTYKGIGTKLIEAVVKESKRLGYNGRVYLNTSTINSEVGTPVPFYEKLGFKSVDSSIEDKIEKSISEHLPLPKECEATTMYLPKEKINEILSRSA